MEECMDAKMQVMEQDPNASVICIPYYKEDKSAKMSERMGGMMREMMGMMKEYNDE
jgi:hypothetical protein